ncbi:MAG: hypothetical protein DRR15_15085 [Gammaproteobacteria bacterium]|nr:MAG: hypothetical protein DRR15_15085 [Gammaproteobacteria bacterium]
MSRDFKLPSNRCIESLDQNDLEKRLREVAGELFPDRVMDPLEVRHLVRVITECSMLLTDVYSEERIDRIMNPDRGLLGSLVDSLIDQQRRGEGEALYRVRRLPDDVRVVGDKALFDLSLLGLREVRGYDIAQLGSRAYHMAGEALKLLAEDRRLRDFFKQNRLLMLPLEEEVVFLHQCSEKFGVYANILRRTHGLVDPGSQNRQDLADRVPLMAAAAEALVETDVKPAAVICEPQVPREPPADRYLDAARGEMIGDSKLSKERLISGYERVLLFSSLDMSRLRDAMLQTVIDQQTAVEALCDEFSLYGAGTRDPSKPPAYFLVGPTGVGKNHLVESLCCMLEGVWDIEIPALTIEGPNYTYPSDINELRGATRGFIRSDEEGLLTSFHGKSSRAPLAVILIDEVEKAHPHLLTFFLSILDRGTTTDNRGDVLNFSNCMMFFTSNLGYSTAQQNSAPIGYGDDESRQDAADGEVRRHLKLSLTPEFVNRVRMIHFNRLTQSSAESIFDLELRRIARRYEELHGLRLELDPPARTELIRRGFSPIFGARHLASTLDGVCNVEIAKKVREDDQGNNVDRRKIIDWLREMRAGERPFDAQEAKRRVEELSRARLNYDVLRVVFKDGEFEYVPQRTSG